MASLEESAVTGSDSDLGHPHFHCQPCETDGTFVTAVGYCRNCEEYLCQRCYDCHLVPSVTRKHVLVIMEHPRDSEKHSVNFPMRCEQHKDETIVYHCLSHSILCCHTCFFENHRACVDVKFIPKVAKDVTLTEEYKEFNATLTWVAENYSDLVSKMESYEKDIDVSRDEVIRAFQTHKKEVLDAIDNLEKQFMERVDKLKEEETLKIVAMKNKFQTSFSECERISSAIALLQTQRQDCELYRTMVQTKKRLMLFETEILDLQSKVRKRKLEFKANTDVLNALKQPFGLGLLNDTTETRRIQKLDHVYDINIKSTSDTGTSCIEGLVLVSKDKLVLTSYNKLNVKLLDPGRNKVVSELNLNSNPCGVCKVDDNRVAVALDGQKIMLVALEPSLSVVREIAVTGRCRGVGYCDGKLLVSSPNKLEILDMQGAVLSVIQNDRNGHPLFYWPIHLCVNANSKLIYVSDYQKQELLCLKFDGTVVCRYSDSELVGPGQAVVDSSGTVYVCGQISNNVHQVTGDCQKVRVLLSAADGLNSPKSICYDEDSGWVYIGQANYDYVKVYKVISEQI